MTGPLPPQGVIEAGWHRFPIRVYYEDTDAGGVVYHATYLRFVERARSEMLRVLGWTHERTLAETGCYWVVHRLEAEYRRPARLDDALTVATRPLSLGGARLRVRQIVRRGDEALATVTLELVLLTTSGRPARLPPDLRDAFLPFLSVRESASDPCPSIQ